MNIDADTVAKKPAQNFTATEKDINSQVDRRSAYKKAINHHLHQNRETFNLSAEQSQLGSRGS